MKHIKTFETLNQNKPQIDDYVICQPKSHRAFHEDNTYFIAKITNIAPENDFRFEYYTTKRTYKNIEKVYYVNLDEIKYWSTNKKEIKSKFKTLTQITKYNL